MRYDLRPMGLGEMLDRGLKLYLSNLGPLLGVSLAVMIPLGFFTAWLQGSAAGEESLDGGPATPGLGVTMAIFLIGIVVNGLLQGALIQGISDIYLEGKTSAGTMLQRAAARFIPLLVASTLYALAIFGGVFLLIVGAFIFLAAFFAAQCVVMLEKKGAWAAMGRSWRLTKGHRNRAFSTLFATALITAVFNVVVAFGLGMLQPGPFMLQLGTTVISAFFVPYQAVVTILLYYDLRIRKEAFDLQVLAREMGVTPAAAPAP